MIFVASFEFLHENTFHFLPFAVDEQRYKIWEAVVNIMSQSNPSE